MEGSHICSKGQIMLQRRRPCTNAYRNLLRNRNWGMNRALGISGCVLFASIGCALVSSQTTMGCYEGMKQADVNSNHAIDWDEYQKLLVTFALLNFDECDIAHSPDSSAIRTQFAQVACSCSGYQGKLLNTTVPLPECSCSEDNATVVIPGIYREPYSRNICQNIDTLLDSLCGAMSFSPKPLREKPVPSEDTTEVVSIPIITHPPTTAPIAVVKEQKRHLIPLVVSAGAVLLYLCFMVHRYRRHGHQVRKLSPMYDDTLPSVMDHPCDNDTEPARVNGSKPFRLHRSKFGEPSCTTMLHHDQKTLPSSHTDGENVLPPPYMDGGNEWTLGNNTTIPDSLKEIYIIEEDDVLDYSTYLEEGLRPSSASSSLPHDITAFSPRQVKLNDAVDSIVSDNKQYRSSGGGWMVKSFDKHRFDGLTATSTVNYNDVSATQYRGSHTNGSGVIYRTDLIDEEVDEYGCSTTMKNSIKRSEDIGNGYSTEDDGNDGEDEDGDFDNGLVGPIDIDDGQIVPHKKQSKALRGHNRKKHKITKLRSVKGVRAAYMKQAQAISSNSLKPIPESTLIRAKPFVI